MSERWTLRTVEVPAYQFFPVERLVEAVSVSGGWTSGLCRTVEEAQERATALDSGQPLLTQAPDYQANEAEMAAAAAKFVGPNALGIRDGGFCQQAIEAAVKAGIHTVEWAIASRYLVAGWV